MVTVRWGDYIMNTRTTYFLSTLVALLAGTASVANASPTSFFSTFPARCSDNAFLQVGHNLDSPSATLTIVTDDGAWESPTRRVNLLYGDLMAPSTTLLSNAADNQSKPRISNRQSRQAQKILQKYEREVLWRTPLLNSVGTIQTTSTFDQYKCLTDTCPKGVTCTALPIAKERDEFRDRLPLLRDLHEETMALVSTVPSLKRKVPQLRRTYDRVEKKIATTLQNLPERIYVIDEFIARK
jgi:hypothetical protein